MQSILLTGGNTNRREEKARQLATENSSQFDTRIFNTEEERGVDLAREILSETTRKPYDSKLTTIVILEAHRLTIDAQNTLLKLLEEPNDSLQLILTSFSKSALLPTVASRVLEVTMETSNPSPKNLEKPPANELLSSKLEKISKTKPEDYISYWEKLLIQESFTGNKANLIAIHRFNKLLIKMQRARKTFLNGKLIDLIIALETPNL